MAENTFWLSEKTGYKSVWIILKALFLNEFTRRHFDEIKKGVSNYQRA